MEIFLYEEEFSSFNSTIIGGMTITLPTSTTRTGTATSTTTTTTSSTVVQAIELKTEEWQQQFDDMFNATVICKLIH